MVSHTQIVTFVACLSLSGCASQLWAKPGGSPAEFEGAKSACNTQSYGLFPPMMQQVMISQGYVTPMQTSCTGSGYAVNCFTTGGSYVQPTYMPVDQNQGARSSAVRSCLMTAGWQPVKDREEAALVTNATPSGATASPSMSGFASWDTARAACRQQATASVEPFPNAFDACMKGRGL